MEITINPSSDTARVMLSCSHAIYMSCEKTCASERQPFPERTFRESVLGGPEEEFWERYRFPVWGNTDSRRCCCCITPSTWQHRMLCGLCAATYSCSGMPSTTAHPATAAYAETAHTADHHGSAWHALRCLLRWFVQRRMQWSRLMPPDPLCI